MASSPACRFYFGDFDMDTSDLSCEEVGAYMRLLSHQWEHEVVPKTLQKRARVCRLSVRKMKSIWDEIERFFVSIEGGFVNPRMEEERLKQAEFSRKMKEAGRKGGLASGSSQASSQSEAELDLPLSVSPQERELNTAESSLSNEPSTASGVDW